MASYASLFSASELQFKFDMLLPVMLMQRAVVHRQSKSSPSDINNVQTCAFWPTPKFREPVPHGQVVPDGESHATYRSDFSPSISLRITQLSQIKPTYVQLVVV